MTITLHPVITVVSPADCGELMTISTKTFVDTYAHVNTPENMRSYIEANFSETATKKQLAEEGTQFYLASLDHKTIGYLKLNSGKAQTELKEANTLEIERIYVAKELQGKGIGKSLVEKAFEIAVQQRFDYLWLGVWEHNYPALAFYKRMGFVEFDRHVFLLGNDKQQDIMMKLEIKPTNPPTTINE